MRRLLIFLGGVLVLLVAAALIGPSFVDWNAYKDDLTAELHKATGQDIVIAGDLDMAVLPRPRIAAAKVTVSGAGGGAPLAQIGALKVVVKLLPLLRGAVEIVSIELDRPVVTLEKREDGSANWTITPPTAAKAEPAPSGEEAAPNALSVERLSIVDGTLIYRSPGAPERKIEGLSAEISAGSLTGPLDAKGKLTFDGKPLGFEAALGQIGADGAAPAALKLNLADGAMKSEFSGRIEDLRGTPRVAGTIKLSAADVARAAKALGAAGAAPSLPLALGADLTANATEIAANDLDLRLGDTGVTGGLSVALGDRMRADVALRSRRIDLDALLAAMKAGAAAPPPAGGTAAPDAAGPVLPDWIDGTVELAVDAVSWHDQQVRDLKLTAALTGGALTLERLEAALPGGASVSLKGKLQGQPAMPFDGTVDFSANDLRGLLNWFGIDTGGISADRLRAVSLAAQIRGNNAQAQLVGVHGRLDASAYQGGVTVAFRRRPSFGISLNVDHVNIDGYLPAAPSGAQPGKQAEKKTPAAAPLAALDSFDANMRLSVGSVTYQRSAANGVSFDGTLLDGTLDIRRAAIDDLAGASLALSGKASNFAKQPQFDGKFSGRVRDLSTVLRLAGVQAGGWARALGPVSIAGTAKERAKASTLNAEFGAADGRLRVGAELQGGERLHLQLGADHPDATRLARIFDLPLTKGADLGKLSFTAAIDGKPDSASVDAAVFLAGGKTRLTGTVAQPLGTPSVALALDVNYPSLSPLVRAFGDSDAAKLPALAAPASLTAKIKGGAKKVEVTDIALKAMKSDLTGRVSLAMATPRPRVDATLKGGDIDLALLAAPAAKARGKKAKKAEKGGSPFTRDPIDLSGLGAFDGSLGLTAKAIKQGNIDLRDAKLDASLKDSVLTIATLTGKLFGGGLSVSGTLDGADRPVLKGKLALDKANLKRALFETQGMDLASGQLSAQAAFDTAGRSTLAMARRFAGTGQFDVRDGVVKGIDLEAVGKRLGKTRNLVDIVPVLDALLSKGKTPFRRLRGDFVADKGLIRTVPDKPIRLSSDAVRATATGKIDLPRWRIDMKSEAKLKEAKGFPPLEILITGPLDQPKKELSPATTQALLGGAAGGLLQRLAPGKKSRKSNKKSGGKSLLDRLPIDPQRLLQGR